MAGLGLRSDDETNERAKIVIMGAIGMTGLVMTLCSTQIIISISGVIITFVMCVGIWYGILARPTAKIEITDKKCKVISGVVQLMLKLHNKGKGREITVAAWDVDGRELDTGWYDRYTDTARITSRDAAKFLDSRRQAWTRIQLDKRALKVGDNGEINEKDTVNKHYVKVQFYEAAQIYIYRYCVSETEPVEEVGMYMAGLIHWLGRYRVNKKLKEMGLINF